MAPDAPSAFPPASPRPVALVTGAARRIGRAIALELAAQGWDVAVHCHRSFKDAEDTAAQAVALGARAEVFCADLANASACEALVPAVLLRCGQLDAVVNNASLFEYDDVAGFSIGTMERHWRANTAPAIVLARALHEHVVQREATGCVVNLLDQKLANPNPDYFSYTLSKAALDAATTMLAQALAPAVRVCGVSPGLVLESEFINSPRLQQLQQATPLGRGVQVAHLAQAVRFLIENPSITGVNLMVDSGSHLAPGRRDFAFMSPDPLSKGQA